MQFYRQDHSQLICCVETLGLTLNMCSRAKSASGMPAPCTQAIETHGATPPPSSAASQNDMKCNFPASAAQLSTGAVLPGSMGPPSPRPTQPSTAAAGSTSSAAAGVASSPTAISTSAGLHEAQQQTGGGGAVQVQPSDRFPAGAQAQSYHDMARTLHLARPRAVLMPPSLPDRLTTTASPQQALVKTTAAELEARSLINAAGQRQQPVASSEVPQAAV